MQTALVILGLVAVVAMGIVAILAIVFGRGFRREVSRERFSIQTDGKGRQ